MSENAYQIALSRTTDQEMQSVLSTSLYVGAQQASIALVLSYCKAAGLDPLQKPVHIVPMWDSKAGAMRDVIMPAIGLYRTQAARTNRYAGMSEPEFGPDVTENIGGVEITYPKYCKVRAYRLIDGTKCEFIAMEFWKENYAVSGGKEKSIAPNTMWQKRPYAQLAKCAEAQALRKAFPECGHQPTAEEMEGKEIEINPRSDPVEKENKYANKKQAQAEEVVIEGEVLSATEASTQSAAASTQAEKSVATITEAMARSIRSALSKSGVEESALTGFFGVESVEQIAITDVNKAIKFAAKGSL